MSSGNTAVDASPEQKSPVVEVSTTTGSVRKKKRKCVCNWYECHWISKVIKELCPSTHVWYGDPLRVSYYDSDRSVAMRLAIEQYIPGATKNIGNGKRREFVLARHHWPTVMLEFNRSRAAGRKKEGRVSTLLSPDEAQNLAEKDDGKQRILDECNRVSALLGKMNRKVLKEEDANKYVQGPMTCKEDALSFANSLFKNNPNNTINKKLNQSPYMNNDPTITICAKIRDCLAAENNNGNNGKSNSENINNSSDTNNNSGDIPTFPTIEHLRNIISTEYNEKRNLSDVEVLLKSNDNFQQAMCLLRYYHKDFSPIPLDGGAQFYLCNGNHDGHVTSNDNDHAINCKGYILRHQEQESVPESNTSENSIACDRCNNEQGSNNNTSSTLISSPSLQHTSLEEKFQDQSKEIDVLRHKVHALETKMDDIIGLMNNEKSLKREDSAEEAEKQEDSTEEAEDCNSEISTSNDTTDGESRKRKHCEV